jgi:C1A family cysteine protease
MNLRDGTTTEDRRLDRLIQFDARSRSFPVTHNLQDKSPRSYTWRNTEWYDQGREGACVAFALGHELNARPAEIMNIPQQWLVRNVYWEAQKIDPWQGGSYPGASPFYEGTSVLAGVKVLQKKGLFEEYRWAFSLKDLVLGVGYSGPAVIGVNWYEGMFNTQTSGFIYPTGNLAGGHAVLVRGVNIKEERFLIRNSWGKPWGRNGDCYITFKDMNTLLSQFGEAVFLKKRTKNYTIFN